MKYNPEEYESIIVGKPKLVSEMTKSELQQELCAAMQLIDNITTQVWSVKNKIVDWNEGYKPRVEEE